MGCWSSGRGEAGPPGGSSQVAGWLAGKPFTSLGVGRTGVGWSVLWRDQG